MHSQKVSYKILFKTFPEKFFPTNFFGKFLPTEFPVFFVGKSGKCINKGKNYKELLERILLFYRKVQITTPWSEVRLSDSFTLPLKTIKQQNLRVLHSLTIFGAAITASFHAA